MNVIDLRVIIERAPEGDGKEFKDWCEEQDFIPLNSGRRAWCKEFSTYLRDFDAVCTTLTGERFLIDTEWDIPAKRLRLEA